ncbi:MAG: TetR/AcrR family transcriptional regulator [bacterium]|nr:TetR/AcrR family transcriptional regulator [bacterium]
MEKKKPGRPSKNDSRRVEILEKAANCFTQFGFNKTTLDDIGDALGFNKAALYYYFKNKEELFSNVMKYELARLWDRLREERTNTKGFENKMLEYFEIRTDGWIALVKLNGLSKDNLINLNETFSNAIMSFRGNEVQYLTSVIQEQKTKHNNTEIAKFLNNLLDVQTYITMSGILLESIDTDAKKLVEIKAKKNLVLMYYLSVLKSDKLPV